MWVHCALPIHSMTIGHGSSARCVQRQDGGCGFRAVAATAGGTRPYTVVNFDGSFKLAEHLEAYGWVENLFDEDYREVFGYNTQGQTAFLGLKGMF